MYKHLPLLLVLVLLTGCVDPEFRKTMTEGYPELYEVVFERDASAILTFTRHEDPEVREQAWRALISTQVPPSGIDSLIDRVAEANTAEAWASLWHKELDNDHLEKLHKLWVDQPALRAGLASVFGLRGNTGTFRLLMDTPVMSDDRMEYEHALAIGRLSMREDLTPEDELEIINRALNTTDTRLATAYLYGFYRTRKELSDESQRTLLGLWEDYYPEDRQADQYIARILMRDFTDRVLYHFPIESYQTMNVRLAVELATGIGMNEFTDYGAIVLNALLDHRNPLVQTAALQAIQRHEEHIAERLTRDILNKIGLNTMIDDRVRLVALNTIYNPEEYEALVHELAGNDPYLQPLRYQILEKIKTDDEFFEILKQDIASEDRLIRFYAVQQLNRWWPNVADGFKTESNTEMVKATFTEALKTADRSMIYVMQNLLMNEQLIANSEYGIIEDLLGRFRLPEDVEVYQSVSQVLKNRFEEEAYPLIDSLASQGNVALNRTLINQGWDILQGDYYPTEFRTPDWDRLARLGPNPELVLATHKGDIRIRMNTKVAPVTIAGMDSLIEAGAYNNVPFHRVVPNFVIQGGDVESQDGFGGPDYVVPTEASASQYRRAKVGIASAGRDTEGSQYFVMHQWAPHLNGLYTMIGEVVDGMEVADRIVVGDRVRRAYWD